MILFKNNKSDNSVFSNSYIMEFNYLGDCYNSIEQLLEVKGEQHIEPALYAKFTQNSFAHQCLLDSDGEIIFDELDEFNTLGNLLMDVRDIIVDEL